MKRIIASIVAVTATVGALGQTPVKLSDDNLKGNVFAVKYGKYEYKENFGEPTEGELLEQSSMSFDEQGRSVAISQESHSYVMEYLPEGANTKVTVDDVNFGQKNIYIYDNNNVVIKQDFYDREELAGRLTSSYIGSKDGYIVYEGKIYNRQGVSTVEFRAAYKNGLLMMVNNKLSNNYNAHQEIKRYDPGVFTYDSNGNITSKVFNKPGDRLYYVSKYSYNANGALVKYVAGTAYNTDKLNDNDAHTLETYSNYKYDQQGNWIYRTVDADRPRYIEKRQITYR